MWNSWAWSAVWQLTRSRNFTNKVCKVLAKNETMQDTKKELIIILLPNNSRVLMTDPACTTISEQTHWLMLHWKKRVKMSICIVRLMYKTPLTHICVTETEPPGRYLGHRTACKHSPVQWPNNRPQAAVGLHLRNPSLMDYYSFNRPRRDGWLSWPCWLTDSGRFTHKMLTQPASKTQ